MCYMYMHVMWPNVTSQIMVIAGVYYGDESLCADGKTRAMHLDGGVCVNVHVHVCIYVCVHYYVHVYE